MDRAKVYLSEIWAVFLVAVILIILTIMILNALAVFGMISNQILSWIGIAPFNYATH